jgi:uncharacterized protein (DUF2252 family)
MQAAELVPATIHPTVEQRTAAGRAARAITPRRSHASWDPPATRADPIAILESQALSRVEELLPIRYARMLTSPFAFFRGGAAIMAADLALGPRSGIDVQLCGDAHLGNFGGFASPDRSVVFSINDFDETLPGPWEWDVKRLAASTVIAARERGFSDKECNSIAMTTVGRYRAAMRGFAAQRDLEVWYARMDVAAMLSRWRAETSAKTVRAVGLSVDKARTHDSLAALAKLTHEVEGETRIVSDPPTIVPIEELLPGASAADVAEIFDVNFGIYKESLPGERRRLLERFRFVHLARKVVGVGSVATRAWIVLLIGRDRDDPLFLQVKESPGSALEPFLDPSQFDNQGQRVVEGQRLMQAASDIFLGWFRTQGIQDGLTRDFYVRQLWDWKLSAHIERMSPEAMRVYGGACGWTLARAHARSGDRIAIASYLGAKRAFETAIAEFARHYADQNERDYAALVDAVRTGRLVAKER